MTTETALERWQRHFYQRSLKHMAFAFGLFWVASYLTPIQDRWDLYIFSLMFFGGMGYFFIRLGLGALFPLLPWYRFRQLNCRCGQPPIKPATARFLRPRSPPKWSLRTRQLLRRIVLGYYPFHTYGWLGLNWILALGQRDPMVSFSSIVTIYAFSHFILGALLRLWVFPLRIPRRLYLYYCPCMKNTHAPPYVHDHRKNIALDEQRPQFGEPGHPETNYYFYQ